MNDDWYWALSVLLLALMCAYLFYLLKFRYASATGQLVVVEEDGKKTFSLEIDKDPDEIASMAYVIFKVVDHPSEGFD
ncbi:MAG: hypothetical protein ABWY25_06265 [Paenisporosarcina sp.]